MHIRKQLINGEYVLRNQKFYQRFQLGDTLVQRDTHLKVLFDQKCQELLVPGSSRFLKELNVSRDPGCMEKQ